MRRAITIREGVWELPTAPIEVNPFVCRVRGTRDLPAPPRPGGVPSENLGCGWFWSLRMETLGRNLATAGGLALAERLGELKFDLARVGNER